MEQLQQNNDLIKKFKKTLSTENKNNSGDSDASSIDDDEDANGNGVVDGTDLSMDSDEIRVGDGLDPETSSYNYPVVDRYLQDVNANEDDVVIQEVVEKEVVVEEVDEEEEEQDDNDIMKILDNGSFKGEGIKCKCLFYNNEINWVFIGSVLYDAPELAANYAKKKKLKGRAWVKGTEIGKRVIAILGRKGEGTENEELEVLWDNGFSNWSPLSTIKEDYKELVDDFEGIGSD